MADLQTICVDDTCMNNPIAEVDSALSSTSTNPVENRVIKNYLDALEARVAALENCVDCSGWIGVDNVSINQGSTFDPTDGVTALNAQGQSVPFTVSPNSIDTCTLGTHTLTYSATGLENATRVVTVVSAGDPVISGVSQPIQVLTGEQFDPLSGVSAVDGNGNTVTVSYEAEPEPGGGTVVVDTSAYSPYDWGQGPESLFWWNGIKAGDRLVVEMDGTTYDMTVTDNPQTSTPPYFKRYTTDKEYVEYNFGLLEGFYYYNDIQGVIYWSGEEQCTDGSFTDCFFERSVPVKITVYPAE